MSDRATDLVTAHPGFGVERLFALVDELVDDSVDQRQALRALIRAHRLAEPVVSQEDLRSGASWRAVPSVAEVVVPVTVDVALHIELAPAPSAVLLTWRQTRGAEPPVEVERLRARTQAGTGRGGALVDPSLARLAVSLRHRQVGVPFAAGRVIEAILEVVGAGVLVATPALAGVVAEAVTAIEVELAGLPVELLRRLGALRASVGGWAQAASAVWPEDAARWRAITDGLPRGNEPDPAIEPWSADVDGEVPAPTTPTYVYRGEWPEPALFLSGPVLLTRLFDATFAADIAATARRRRRIRLPLATAVAEALRAARADAAAVPDNRGPGRGAAIRAEQSWWRLRTTIVHPAGAPVRDADPAHALPSLAVLALRHGGIVARTALTLDPNTGSFDATLDTGLEVDTLLVALTGELDPDPENMHRWADRLLVAHGAAAAAHLYEALSAIVEPDQLLGDEPDPHAIGIRALAAAKAAWCLRQRLGAPARERGTDLSDLAHELRPQLADAVESARHDSLTGVRPAGELQGSRGLVAAAARALIRDDPGGHQLDELRVMGSELDALDRITHTPPAR